MVEDYRFEVYTYEALDGKQFVVRFFDFDSVIGVGDTIEEAIEDGKGNLEFYIKYCDDKNIPYPSPSKYEEIEYSGKVTLRLPKSLHKLASEKATKEGVSLNALLSDAVANYVYGGTLLDKCVESMADNIATVSQNLFDKTYEYVFDKITLCDKNNYTEHLSVMVI